ncbi:hypothetical protein [Novosphingobium sp. 1529]|uniref:hypothetical protein n=1 Tax=Novosphingobium sp. 1529 TaxID=3156424 RepID=UPI003394E0A2
MVLGHSRWLWGRFCPNQGLETVMRCHIAAFEAMAGCCTEILYDRMKTAVIGEDAAGVVTYNASLVALLAHYGSAPKACQPSMISTPSSMSGARTPPTPGSMPPRDGSCASILRRSSLICAHCRPCATMRS